MTNFARVRGLHGDDIGKGILISIMMCLLITCISAAPVCRNTTLKFNEIGLCSPNGSVDIWHCASCQPGFGQSVECGQMYKLGTRISCDPCATGTYSDTYDISQCKKCNPCQKNEVKSGQCSSYKDSITCTCKSGYYRDPWQDCKLCSWCCGNKTNKYVPACNVPQVPPGKQCSFQTAKSCAPTTPNPTTDAPTTAAPTTVAATPTNPPTTGKSSSSSSATKAIEKTTMTKKDNTKKSSNSLLPTGVLNDKEIAKDPLEEESWDKDWGKILSLSALILACLITLFLILYCLHKKRKESRSPNPTASGQPLLHGNIGSENVHLNPNDATAAYHVPEGPNGGEPSQGNEIRLPTTRLDEEQISFIIEKLGTKIVDLKHDIMQTLCKMLNVQVNGKDYRNLDSFCNLDYFDKQNLKKENPMEDIICVMVSKSKTLESFLDELYRISRGDVVERLYEIANTQGQ